MLLKTNRNEFKLWMWILIWNSTIVNAFHNSWDAALPPSWEQQQTVTSFDTVPNCDVILSRSLSLESFHPVGQWLFWPGALATAKPSLSTSLLFVRSISNIFTTVRFSVITAVANRQNKKSKETARKTSGKRNVRKSCRSICSKNARNSRVFINKNQIRI